MTVYEPNADQLKELLALTEVKFRSSRLAIKIFSEFLESEIYLVSDPSLASEVDGVAYTPEEVKALMKIHGSREPHYKERLQKIHDAKRIFDGKIIPHEGE